MENLNKTLTKTEIKKRMQQLILLLEQWKYERYFLQQESVPLEIYDQHFEELLELEKKHNFYLPESPTKK